MDSEPGKPSPTSAMPASSTAPANSPVRGLAAFASRDFRLYQMARMAVIIGAEAQTVAVAWQVYSITHRALDLGYTGLALFLPGLFFLLPAGHAADRYDRRQIILLCYALQILCTGALLAIAVTGMRNVHLIYAVLFRGRPARRSFHILSQRGTLSMR